MDEIIKILMRRDSISENEARNLVEECTDAIQDLFYTTDGNPRFLYDEATNIIEEYLGLEPDYLEYLL